jgi:nucleotide-binding universal stress UspA family protein
MMGFRAVCRLHDTEREDEIPMQNAEQATASSDPAAIFRRVLVPVDFGMVSHRAVHVALELRRVFGARLCVLNLTHKGANDQFLSGIGSPTTTSDLMASGGAELRRFVDNIAPGQGDSIEYAVHVADDYVAGIRDEANKWGATLIVLSRESHRALLRTHSEKVIMQLQLPVLLIQTPPDSSK